MPVSISGTNGVTFPDSSLQAAAASPFGLKNRIINGGMMVSQRNGTTNTSTGLAAVTYNLDRWLCYATGAALTVQQITSSISGLPPYAAQITGAASNTGVIFEQRIESRNISDAAGQTVTLSWHCSSSTLTSLTYVAQYADSVDNWATATTITTGTKTINSTDTQYTVTFTLPAQAVNGIRIYFQTGAFTSGTLKFTGVQLEQNTSATPFERRLYGQELANCQRYYWKTFVVDTAPAQNIAAGNQIFNICTNNISNGLYFPVSMRATPTITTFNPYAANASFRVPNTSTDIAVTPSEISSSGIAFFSMTRTAPSALHGHITASIEL